jgi:MFS transporter, ACS family, hexuronate transporter
MNSPNAARWWVCGLLLFATTLNYLDRVALNALAKPLMSEFRFGDGEYANLESAFAVAFGLGTLFAGWLVDRVNVRWVYPAMVFGWSLAGFCTGFASSFTMLMICRVVLGLFEAGNWPCGIRTIRTVLPPEERSFGNSLFQSGTAIGAIVAPFIVLGCSYAFGPEAGWAIPFRLIGLLGGIWIAAWFAFAPKSLFPPPLASTEPRPPFWRVLADRRFWILVAVIIGTNTGWHTLRVWMVRLMSETYGFDRDPLQYFTAAYYLSADIGSWTIGLITLYLARRGRNLSRVRIGCYLGCTAIYAVAAGLLPWSTHWLFAAALLMIVGFAALGLFPTYFALSQDLSSHHMGKVTGTLGLINALYLACVFEFQGRLVKAGYYFDYAIAFSSAPAAIASLVLLVAWRRTL